MSLVELVVVITVIGGLATFAVPVQQRATHQSRDMVAAATLRAVLLTQFEHFDSHGTFTVDRSALLRIEPGLGLGSEGKPGSVYMVVGISKENPAVCLFMEGGTGWHTVYHSEQGGTLTRLGGPGDCTRRMLEEQRQPRRQSPSRARPIPGWSRITR
jgi:type II secretory pathway pseudopilin PulG